MKYYRVYEKIGGRSPLGYGLSAGRWNEKHTPVIYCASSTALAMLEHYSIKGSIVSTSKWELATLELDLDIPKIEIRDLPKDWNRRPHSGITQRFGSDWALNRGDLCLKIPSVQIPLSRYPEEHNLIINPLFPDFGKFVSIGSTEEIGFVINDQI